MSSHQRCKICNVVCGRTYCKVCCPTCELCQKKTCTAINGHCYDCRHAVSGIRKPKKENKKNEYWLIEHIYNKWCSMYITFRLPVLKKYLEEKDYLKIIDKIEL